jgi:hypothetical protein
MPLTTYAKKINNNLEWSNKKEIEKFLEKENYKGEYVVTIKRLRKVRTTPQNNALHKFYELLANKFNEKNITVQLFLTKVIELDWTPELVKEIAWRPLQRLLLQKKSTTELDNINDINTVYEHLNKHLGQEFGIYEPFPHKEKEEFDIESVYPQEELTPKF